MKRTAVDGKKPNSKKDRAKPITTGSHPPTSDQEKDYDDWAHETGIHKPTNITTEDPDDLAHGSENEEENIDEIMPRKDNRHKE